MTFVQQNIYDSIRKREIIMPEEHTGQLGFEYAWKELLARTRHAGECVESQCTVTPHDTL
jgi:golgi-specific brefeldin A-resistance guanine nucleotide exchange factor 1